MSPLTPEYYFPEVEQGAAHAYGTAWPLSEDFYLCIFHSGLYLLDRFGNRDVIYDPGPGPYRVRDPFPLRPRPRPPVLPVATWQGKRAARPDHRRAVISVMNVYASDGPARLPKGIKVQWMRIVQVIPQLLDNWFSRESVSQVSFVTDSKACVPCHQQHPDAPDMSYASLARHDLLFSCPGERPALVTLGVGGSRTTPGRFGAHASGLMKILTTTPEHRDVHLTKEQWPRLTLWLDLNSNEIGWVGNDRSQIAAQKRGEALWPPIDVDPANPTGVERDFPVRPLASDRPKAHRAGSERLETAGAPSPRPGSDQTRQRFFPNAG